jgi:UDP-galactopyranose mutase
VRALLPDGTTTPLPVNRTTLETIFQLQLSDEVETQRLLDSIRQTSLQPSNCDELFLSSVGERLANLLFRPYTRKMWGLDAIELDLAIGARLPVRTNRDERYFTDSFQALPSDGYTQMFERILDHNKIRLQLNYSFERGMERDYVHSFLCMPIDHYFGNVFGKLPYRSIRFHHSESAKSQEATVINMTDSSPYTRTTQWSLLPNSGQPVNAIHTLTKEEPCTMEDNPGEYYYPVQTAQSKTRLDLYRRQASTLNNITFCGRTGLFRYIDMIPAVTLHLELADRFLHGRKLSRI